MEKEPGGSRNKLISKFQFKAAVVRRRINPTLHCHQCLMFTGVSQWMSRMFRRSPSEATTVADGGLRPGCQVQGAEKGKGMPFMGGPTRDSLLADPALGLTSPPSTSTASRQEDMDTGRWATCFPDHLFHTGDSLRPRYKLTTSDELQQAAARGCPICDRLLQRAIDFFWNSESALDEPGIQRRRTWTTVKRPFTRALCIALQPGSSLLLFRVILYDDIPDRTFVHALTVRDSVARIEFYREPSLVETQHPVYPAVGSAAHVPASITLDRAAELAAKWMKRCDATHPKCTPTPSQLPKRLIDVQDGVKLVEPLVEEGISLDAPYMTLSHCWGSQRVAKHLLKTTHDTLWDHRQQIPWDELPRLFQDAILLVRALGCRYLWIDSLCIIQDDQEDWMVESAKMSDTYSNAMLNIAATAMRNSSIGLFNPRKHGQGFRELRHSLQGTTVESSLETIEMTADEPPIFSRVSHDRSHEVLYGDMEYFRTPMEPLLNRAWVFQERLLSRRTLHFGASEVLFECRTDCFCECSRIGHAHALSSRNVNAGPTGLGQDGNDDGTQSTRYIRPKKVLFFDVCKGSVSALDFWLRAVEEYSFLLLTREQDRPFALAGIAKRIQCACLDGSDEHSGLIHSPYLAGPTTNSSYEAVVPDLNSRKVGKSRSEINVIIVSLSDAVRALKALIAFKTKKVIFEKSEIIFTPALTNGAIYRHVVTNRSDIIRYVERRELYYAALAARVANILYINIEIKISSKAP
ncbi:heterokaryon incompatibility protein-domain-containing protein [Podospora conica]|nr:heterokaryon incompatibility protein-domain-containing protein [Schizothecium conicum]